MSFDSMVINAIDRMKGNWEMDGDFTCSTEDSDFYLCGTSG